MAEIPITIRNAIIYPKDKGAHGDPFPAGIIGFASITGLTPEHPIVLPPDQVPPVDPPLIIWGGPIDPYPDHGLPVPPDLPPVDPPASSTNPVKPNAWNWNDGTNPQYPNAGWYYVTVPGPTDPQPHRR